MSCNYHKDTKNNSISTLNVCMFNARSIVNKTAYLKSFIQQNKYNLIFIVETWLNKLLDNFDSLICPHSYNIIRKDRHNRKVVVFKDN